MDDKMDDNIVYNNDGAPLNVKGPVGEGGVAYQSSVYSKDEVNQMVLSAKEHTNKSIDNLNANLRIHLTSTQLELEALKRQIKFKESLMFYHGKHCRDCKYVKIRNSSGILEIEECEHPKCVSRYRPHETMGIACTIMRDSQWFWTLLGWVCGAKGKWFEEKEETSGNNTRQN